ncbi:MAG: class I SAM-dependent methyltransferase [Betaproteobacteria bacterium]|nr:class I SAM-dependent methyltransferase [Betaproteobacteria bacterium]
MRIDHDLQEVADFWSRRYRLEGFIWGAEPSPCARAAVSRFRSQGAREVLVLGCGYGRDAKYMADEGFNVTAVDFAEGALELARQWHANGRSRRVTYVLDNIAELGFGDSSFDAVYSHRTLHLLLSREKLEQGITAIHRVLKPGGLACLSVRNPLDPSRAHSAQGSGMAHELSFRPGHKVLYLPDSEFRDVLGRFSIIEFEEMTELESCTRDHDVRLHFVTLKKDARG